MQKIKAARYYGELYRKNHGFHFIVKLIAPVGASLHQYIGKRNQKLSDLLCLDDVILAFIPDLSIDWSEVQNV